MLIGLVFLLVGAGAAFFLPGFAWMLVAFAVLATTKSIYDPAMFAYLGDRVPYDRRGRVMGLLSMTWPGIWLFGVPVVGFMIERFGWRSPFVLVAVVGVLALWLAWHKIRPSYAVARRPARAEVTRKARARLGWLTVPSIAALLVNLLQVAARDNLFIVYGAWR